ncbi:hypothetical protein ASAC_0297 [Acidilobus saccharovorans 345-15]|uniref:DUF4443 domain-containing protein n=1 Tax=Acidilobus saccharovorans (strain DSM 16705 / JCM 18335 / VKM B-2471 / 345-15) TaxID=666510 RepID=D9Q066_ACIS3|nr:hypothetical protein [Acidilobus saccharovorans]ADL18704.1 hypothetical protein ASAC_0297 [Acidilobus saccharovorans 345-15]
MATLKRITAAERGGKPGFGPWHVLEALRKISKYELGRIALSRELGLTEASTKTLLRRLVDEGLVIKDDKGSRTSEKGLQLLSSIGDVLSPTRCSVKGVERLEDCLTLTIDSEPPRDLTKIYEIRDYVVSEGCRLAVVGYLDPPQLGFPGLPSELESALRESVANVCGLSEGRRGTIIIVPSSCGPALVGAATDLLAQECGLSL